MRPWTAPTPATAYTTTAPWLASAFIARAKQLGCSLDEITDLVAVWDGERCGPVQRRFHELVTTKIHTAQTQIAELTAFAAQLQSAAAQLSRQPVDGPCDADCACVADPSPSRATSITLGVKPTDVPIACTLERGAMADRLADWQVVLDKATARLELPDGSLRVELSDDIDLAELAELIAAEQGCCTFFSFTLTVDSRGVGLQVQAPDAASEIVASLFGAPA